MNDIDLQMSDAQHAAAVWLQRIEAADSSRVVVTISPRASLGLWSPGAATVRIVPIDDAGAELSEAVAPLAASALQRLPAEDRQAVIQAAALGARLQVLLSPSDGEFAMRLVHGERAVELVAAFQAPTIH